MIGAVLLLGAASVAAADWRLERDRDGIRVYSREYPGSRVRQFRGETVIDSSPASVLAAMESVSTCRRWLYRCVEAREIERVDFNERYLYQVNSVHPLARSRDLVLHTRIRRDPADGAIVISSAAVPDHCATRESDACRAVRRSGYLRIEQSAGTYRLEPAAGGGARVNWVQHVEPGGYLMDFIVNELLLDIPFESLRNLRRLAATAPFDRAVLLLGGDGQIRGVEYPGH